MENKIKEKLLEIQKAKEQAVAQLNAIIGAENALKSLLETNDGNE